MTTYHETLPERKSSKHSGIRWTPAEPEFHPILGTLVIDTDRARVEYLISEFTTPWAGRAFRFEKLTAGTDKESESYDVFCGDDGPRADTCDCKGFTFKRTCKHADSARALLANRWL